MLMAKAEACGHDLLRFSRHVAHIIRGFPGRSGQRWPRLASVTGCRTAYIRPGVKAGSLEIFSRKVGCHAIHEIGIASGSFGLRHGPGNLQRNRDRTEQVDRGRTGRQDWAAFQGGRLLVANRSQPDPRFDHAQGQRFRPAIGRKCRAFRRAYSSLQGVGRSLRTDSVRKRCSARAEVRGGRRLLFIFGTALDAPVVSKFRPELGFTHVSLSKRSDDRDGLWVLIEATDGVLPSGGLNIRWDLTSKAVDRIDHWGANRNPLP